MLVGKHGLEKNDCRDAASDRSRQASCQVGSILLTIVTTLEGSSGIEWEIRSSSRLSFAGQRKQLHALRGIDDHGILHGPSG